MIDHQPTTCQKFYRQQGARRPGDIISYRRATSSRNQRATSSESAHCGIHAFYVPRSDPDQISVNARCLDDTDVSALKPSRFFDGRNWEAAFAARQASRS